MKLHSLIPLISLAFLLAGSFLNAATLDFTDTENIDTNTGASFTFSKFNGALGTLSAIDLIINSSTPSGSATVTNNSGTNNVTIRYIRSNLEIFDLSGTLGITDYTGAVLDLNTSPTAKLPTSYVLSPSSSQVFSVSGGQSLIGGVAQTIPVSSGAFGAYTGSGSVTFDGFTSLNLNTIGSSYTVDSSLYTAATSLTLRYTYTPTVPVPEPGQVAASLLLLGGIGAYVFLKRRKKTVNSEA